MRQGGRCVVPFSLENFFDEYEHRSQLINLASSDAQPRSIADLKGKGSCLFDDSLLLTHPDVRKGLIPSLECLCELPPGTSIVPTSGAAEAIALTMRMLFQESHANRNRPIRTPLPSNSAFAGLAEMFGVPNKTYTYHPSRGWTVDHLMNWKESCPDQREV
jgi:hypothetical protein